MLDNIARKVIELSYDPLNPRKNYNIAKEYEKIGQTAAATSFYLRAAEYGYESDHLIAYTSLVRAATGFQNLSDRGWSVTNAYLQAISYQPHLPDAYYFLAKYHEFRKEYQESYTYASIGEALSHNTKLDTDYPGLFAIRFEKAVSAWWIGRRNESVEIFTDIIDSKKVDKSYKDASRYNLKIMGYSYEEEIDPLEPVITNYRKFFGREAQTIFDVGTRDGDDAKYLAENLFSNNVYAIDANPISVQQTKERYPWMNVIFSAVSDSDGITQFQQVVSDNKEIAGCSSIFAQKVAEEDVFKDIVKMISVPMQRFDSILSEYQLSDSIIDVIKVDVEGYTWQFLQGMGDKIHNVKLFHLETDKYYIHEHYRNSDEVAEYMRSKGFTLVDRSYEWGAGIEDQTWINNSLVEYHKDYLTYS